MPTQPSRILVLGDTGAGKSETAGLIIDEYVARHRAGRLTVVSRDPYRIGQDRTALARRCRHTIELTDALAERGVDWGSALDAERRLYVHVATADDALTARRLGDLGDAVLARGHGLFVVDEAHRIASTRADPRLIAVWLQGRKHDVDCIAITASAMQVGQHALHGEVWYTSNLRVVFHAGSASTRAKLGRENPPLEPYLADLKTPRDGLTPEFGVYSTDGRAELVTRAGARTIA